MARQTLSTTSLADGLLFNAILELAKVAADPQNKDQDAGGGGVDPRNEDRSDYATQDPQNEDRRTPAEIRNEAARRVGLRTYETARRARKVFEAGDDDLQQRLVSREISINGAYKAVTEKRNESANDESQGDFESESQTHHNNKRQSEASADAKGGWQQESREPTDPKDMEQQSEAETTEENQEYDHDSNGRDDDEDDSEDAEDHCEDDSEDDGESADSDADEPPDPEAAEAAVQTLVRYLTAMARMDFGSAQAVLKKYAARCLRAMKAVR